MSGAHIFDGQSGPLSAQHHDKTWPVGRRLVVQMVRVTGRSDPTKGGNSGYKKDPKTLGFYHGGLVWFANYGQNRAPLWTPVFPAKIEAPGTTISDAYMSNVKGQRAVPQLQQTPGGGDWQPDPGLIPQVVAAPLGQQYPGGTPGLAVALTQTDEQQAAFVPSGGVCIAVHWGGAANGHYGSRVYDVTTAGSLDLTRWAREQSQRRVYKLPTQQGGVPFLFQKSQTPGAPQTTSGPNTLAPGGLAWQLGLNVEDMAGNGVMADAKSTAGAPVDDTGTTDGGNGGAPQTTSKPTPGSIAGLTQGPAAQKGQTGAGQLRVTFYGGFGTSSYNVPWDGTQASLDWLRAHGEQAGYAAGGRLSSVNPVGPVSIPQTVSPPTPPAPTGAPQTVSGVPDKQVLAVATYRGWGPLDCGADGDIHEIVRTPDGEAVNSAHLRETSLWRGGTGDAPAKFDKLKWKPVCPDGPFWLETFWRNDLDDSHPWLVGSKPGLRKWQTSYHFSVPTGQITDGPSSPPQTGTGGGGRTTIGGGDFTLTFDPRQPSSVGVGDSFVATTLPVAFTTLIARPWVLTPGITNAQGQFSALDDFQMAVFNTAPTGARLEAIANQTGYGYQRLTPGAGQYVTGVSDVSGFALTPSNQSVYSRLLNQGAAKNAANLAFLTFEDGALLAFGDSTIGARPANGWQIVRTFTTTDKRFDLIETDSGGSAKDAPSAMTLDFVAQQAYFWGVPVGGPSVRTTPEGYISGFSLAYNATSPSLVDVSGSIARDTTDTYDITLAGPVSADYLSQGGPLKNDALLFADHGATGTVVNAAEATFSALTLTASIIPNLTSTPVTGNVNVSVTDTQRVATMTPTVAGTTKFLSELAVGDIVGSAAWDYFCVISVDSDSSARVTRISGIVIAFTNTAVVNFGPITVQAGAIPSKRVAAMATNGQDITTFGQLNGGANGAGLAVIVGQPPAGGKTYTDQAGRVYALPSWIYLWARRTVAGTATVSWSTQRTTPYTPSTLSGYSIWRRVGVLPIDSDNFVIPFTQNNLGDQRLYMYEVDPAAGSGVTRILNAVGAAAAWTRTPIGLTVPPTSKLALVYTEAQGQNAGAGTSALYLRAASMGTAATVRGKRLVATAATVNSSEYWLATDGAQCFDYTFVSGGVGANASLFVLGFIDVP